MKREIKFRAWDGKEMRPIAGISWRSIFGGGEPERYPNDSIQDVDYGDSDKPNWQSPWENIPFDGYGSPNWDKAMKENNAKEEEYQKEIAALPIMQFTGLKDKNGIEIYEGDIFNFDYPMEVVWDMGSWAVKTIKGSSLLFGYTTDGEVIGNIYENPELLKKLE